MPRTTCILKMYEIWGMNGGRYAAGLGLKRRMAQWVRLPATGRTHLDLIPGAHVKRWVRWHASATLWVREQVDTGELTMASYFSLTQFSGQLAWRRKKQKERPWKEMAKGCPQTFSHAQPLPPAIFKKQLTALFWKNTGYQWCRGLVTLYKENNPKLLKLPYWVQPTAFLFNLNEKGCWIVSRRKLD